MLSAVVDFAGCSCCIKSHSWICHAMQPADVEGPDLLLRTSRTFLELVPAEAGLPRVQSSPALSAENTPSQPAQTDGAPPEDAGDEDEDEDDVYGFHPDHPTWQAARKLMIRNIPARCSYQELDAFLRAHTPLPFGLSLPVNRSGRNCGYAFVTMADPLSLRSLVQALWQQRIPSRQSEKPLRLQPGKGTAA